MTEKSSNHDRRSSPTIVRTRTGETNNKTNSRSRSPQPPMRRGMTVGGNPTTPNKGGTKLLGGLLDKGLFSSLANPSLVGAGGVNTATAKPKNRSQRAASPKRERPSPSRGVGSLSPKPPTTTERASPRNSSRNNNKDSSRDHTRRQHHRDASPMRKRNPSGQPGGNGGPALARAQTLGGGTHHLA